jgi:hypothetical protein
MRQMLATLCVTSSLALVAPSGYDPTGGFHFGILSIAGPLAIVGLVMDTIAISHDLEGVSCDDMGIQPHFNIWNYFFRARLQ